MVYGKAWSQQTSTKQVLWWEWNVCFNVDIILGLTMYTIGIGLHVHVNTNEGNFFFIFIFLVYSHSIHIFLLWFSKFETTIFMIHCNCQLNVANLSQCNGYKCLWSWKSWERKREIHTQQRQSFVSTWMKDTLPWFIATSLYVNLERVYGAWLWDKCWKYA